MAGVKFSVTGKVGLTEVGKIRFNYITVRLLSEYILSNLPQEEMQHDLVPPHTA